MSRAGAESKPPWRRVPRAVRAAVDEALGGRVVRGARIWGGYAPSPTFRLRLADDRRAFLKGTDRTSNEFMRRALVREDRVYRNLQALIAPWAPAYYGTIQAAGWHALVLEDLGPASVPPWTNGRARAAARGYGAFHAATFGQALPRWLPRAGAWGSVARSWEALRAGTDGSAAVEHAAAVAGDRADEARAWLAAAVPRLDAVAAPLARSRPPYALLHLDTRSDNIRLHGDRLRLFDWPFACAGPPELDLAAFAQSLVYEAGGPAPEAFVAWYAERMPVRADVLDRAVAAMAGFFAAQYWQPPVPGLPRLRSIQRRQLRASLAWAARRLDLPDPAWLAAIPD